MGTSEAKLKATSEAKLIDETSASKVSPRQVDKMEKSDVIARRIERKRTHVRDERSNAASALLFLF